jgi:hypothetical protein
MRERDEYYLQGHGGDSDAGKDMHCFSIVDLGDRVSGIMVGDPIEYGDQSASSADCGVGGSAIVPIEGGDGVGNEGR